MRRPARPFIFLRLEMALEGFDILPSNYTLSCAITCPSMGYGLGFRVRTHVLPPETREEGPTCERVPIRSSLISPVTRRGTGHLE